MENKLSRTVAASILAIAALAGRPGTAAAQTASSDAEAKCEALVTANLSTTQDAPTYINTAKLVAASATKPEYCEVEGYVTPQVGILMWLPAAQWNGKFMEVGCGGFCGSTSFIFLCEDPLRKGYACITTDMGHKSQGDSVAWAYNNLQAVVDFAYRATHVTALAGKAIAQSYYGRRPDKSYFHGCSCGGRQALVEAQRFPRDFDGIIVGAPGINYSDLMMAKTRRNRLLDAGNGEPLFDAKSVEVLNSAIIAKCDMNDGVKDGLIGDPRRCRFDPEELICKNGRTSQCLTGKQASAAKALYSDLKSSAGHRVMERASLPGWEATYLGISTSRSALSNRNLYEGFFKYMGFVPNPGPEWRAEKIDFDQDYERLGMIQSLLQADNPDLRKFKEAGGKLIFYHGWADGGPSPLTSIDYYEMVEKAMGGRAATQDFFRLFMVPDMDHCWGGKGAWSIDYLSYLEDWVERGKAPNAMIGAHFTDQPDVGWAGKESDPAKARFTRPVYPYPLRAHYKGTGDPNSSASFKAVE